MKSILYRAAWVVLVDCVLPVAALMGGWRPGRRTPIDERGFRAKSLIDPQDQL